MRLAAFRPFMRRRPLLGIAALLLALLTVLASVWAGTGPVGAQDGSEAPGKPAGLRVSTEQGSLNVTLEWDDVDGAASYLVRWRSVDNGEKLNDGISVQSSGVSITVADYGEWVVRVQACDDSGCGKPIAKRFAVNPDPNASPTPTPTATHTPEPVPAQPTGLRAHTELGSLGVSLDWNDVDRAARYWVRWRSADNEEKLNDGVYVQSSDATITVADYGKWVARAQACNASGCGQPLAREFFTVKLAPTATPTATPEPTATPTPEPTATPTPQPNRPPAVDTHAGSYAYFTDTGLAPRGTLVSKPFHAIFSDPDGDDLAYSVSVPERLLPLVDTLRIPDDGQSDSLAAQSDRPAEAMQHVFFTADADDDWKAITPALADPLVITVTLTATDPDGLSASVSGDFLIDWESLPEPPGEPQNFAVSADPGSLDLLATWDESEDATSYKLRWRQVGGEFGADNAVTVTGAIWGIRVSGAGRWEVRLRACNDGGCGPEAVRSVDVVRAANLRLERSVDGEGNVLSKTLSANWDRVEGAASYTLRWRPAGGNP